MMREEELWDEYCKECCVNPKTPHEVWSFGDDPDMLAELVLRGKKTATSSLYDLYLKDPDEKLPEAGDQSIILNKNGDAICIIKNKKVYSVRFSDVTDIFASKEGEGDCTLEYWRMVHSRFFRNEALQYGMTFKENMLILCEEFEVVYKTQCFEK